ncbi:hypothetical protein DVH05_009892 [Phytophthora capsici]|nr:hypothetical protein DVH05_009892 [Phytophthora capsici]
MRSQELFQPVSEDDTNLSPESLDRGYGSEELSNEASDDEMKVPEPMCYVNDLDSSGSDDDNEDITFVIVTGLHGFTPGVFHTWIHFV